MPAPEPTEGVFKIGDVELYSKTWLTDGSPKAILVFFHGYSDHCNAYIDFFDSVSSRGIAIYTLDQRGWGRSAKAPRERGLTGPTTQVLSDMKAFIESVLDKSNNTPVFVMGCSMGGGQILTFAGTPEFQELIGRIRGWIAEAPLIAFPEGFEPSSIEVFAGRLASKVLPRFQLVRPIELSNLTRDPATIEKLGTDELCHNIGTLEGLAGMLDRAANLDKGVVKLNKNVTSFIVLHGSGDKVTSHLASRKFVEAHNIEDGTYKEYDGGYHMLHSDLGSEEFFKDVGDWILDRCAPKPHI